MKTIALLATLLFALPAGADHHKEDPALPDLADAQKLKKDGFAPLFNGTDLTGWKKVGGTGQYDVKDGAVHGFGKPVQGNTFLRTEKTYKDFVLVFQVKMVDRAGNSGCQFRSNQKNGDGRVYGYQCEHDNFKNGSRAYTAGVYDEARRGWLFPAKDAPKEEQAAFTKQGVRLFKWDDWNTIVIRCQGRHIQTWLNGEKRADFHDADEKDFTAEGFIALQVHGGGSADILWQNIHLKEL